jgi:hypothetical protein
MIKLIITKLNRSRKARDAAGKGKGNKVVRNRYTEPSGSTRRSSDRHVPDLNRWVSICLKSGLPRHGNIMMIIMQIRGGAARIFFVSCAQCKFIQYYLTWFLNHKLVNFKWIIYKIINICLNEESIAIDDIKLFYKIIIIIYRVLLVAHILRN